MSGLVLCVSCGAAVPSGRFCAVCGTPLASQAALSVPSPGPTGQRVLPVTQPHRIVPDAATDVSAPPAGTRARWNGRAAGSLAVAAVVIAAGVVVFGHGNRHTVTGELSLSDSSFQELSAGAGCSGDGGYDDIGTGTEVRVKDEAGALIATGRLGAGSFDGLYCVFPFTVGEVPQATYYEVSAGDGWRDGVHYTEQDLKSQHWAAHLSLGA